VSKKIETKLIPVMVTTEHRGVFFGYSPPTDFTSDTIRIEGARMCLFWAQSVKGILGLASEGPNKECRIGPRVPAINLRKVTSVTECSDDAVKAWEAAPWSK
jgi:hypothetical protein